MHNGWKHIGELGARLTSVKQSPQLRYQIIMSNGFIPINTLLFEAELSLI